MVAAFNRKAILFHIAARSFKWWMKMANSLALAGDVLAGATALAGLILVYLGSLAAGYATYDTTQQPAVRPSFQRRAWFGFAGLAVAIAAAVLALGGKWSGADWMATTSAVLLLVAFGWGISTALLTVLEIR